MTWFWILVIIAIVGLIIYYISQKKKVLSERPEIKEERPEETPPEEPPTV